MSSSTTHLPFKTMSFFLFRLLLSTFIINSDVFHMHEQNYVEGPCGL